MASDREEKTMRNDGKEKGIGKREKRIADPARNIGESSRRCAQPLKVQGLLRHDAMPASRLAGMRNPRKSGDCSGFPAVRDLREAALRDIARCEFE